MPTDARVSLASGDLARTLAIVKEEVRRAPRAAPHRVFLFQLFCVTAEWERALAQLAVAAQLDPAATAMANAYRLLIRCEVLRERVFAGERAPTVLGDPPSWTAALIEALAHDAAGRADAAATLRSDAFDAAEPIAGRIDDAPFEWIADADGRLGPVLEAIVEGRYLWVPVERLRTVVFEPPADLRDQVWQPARFTWENGGETVGFVPTRYPGRAEEAPLALARRTEWTDMAGGGTRGRGQRMFATNVGEHALLDTRRLVIGAA